MIHLALSDRVGYLRALDPGDGKSIARYADNRKIWANLRDLFPHPYGPEDAQAFIAHSREQQPPANLAIVVDDQAVGSIGVRLQPDVERVSAELGYWLAEAYWGRGLATAAVRAMCAYAFPTFGLTRVFALPFATNLASARVLEKAGFRLEARLRRAVIKEGTVCDQLLYAITDEEWSAQRL